MRSARLVLHEEAITDPGELTHRLDLLRLAKRMLGLPPRSGFHRLRYHGGGHAVGVQQRAQRDIEAAPAGGQFQLEGMQRVATLRRRGDGLVNHRADAVGVGEPQGFAEALADNVLLVRQHGGQ